MPQFSEQINIYFKMYFPKIQIETSGTEVEIEVSMGGIFAMIYRKESIQLHNI